MAKLKNLKKQKLSGKKPLILHSPDRHSEPTSSSSVTESLLECVRTGNLNLFRDVLASHIMRSNKLRLAKKTGLGRQTLYDLMDPERNFNPALATVSAIIRGLAE